MSAPVTGPFGSEREVLGHPAVRAVYAASTPSSRPGVLAEGNHRMLLETLEAAGVELGEYDARIVAWLAKWEPQTCAVVAGLITRAAAGGEAAGRAAIAQLARDCGATGRGDEGPSVPFADLIERYRQGQQAAVLAGGDLATVLAALEEASTELRERGTWCASGTCEDCGEREARAAAYDALYARLEVTE